MLEDAIKIGFTRDKTLIERVLQRIKQQITALPYRNWTRVIGPDKPDDTAANTLDIKLQPAGHILGSAYVECRCREQHQGRRQRRLQLEAIIEKSLKDRGAVLIPAFSIGRTQEILYELESIIHDFGNNKAGSDSWQNIEIIVDSPLAENFTSAYR